MAVCDRSDMDEQNHENPCNSSALATNWKANNSSGILGYDANLHNTITRGRNEIDQLSIPILMPQWMHCQQMPQNYVEFLAESGYSEVQKEISYNVSAQVSSLGLADPSQMEEYLRSHDEGNLFPKFTGIGNQFGVQKQDWNENFGNAFQAYTEPDAAAFKHPPTANRKRSREKAYAADRYRRLRISQSLDALQELLPHLKESGKEALLDDVIDHIQYLQHQVKDLSSNRLGGESTSNSFTFLEGHGHYYVREQMLDGPLEDMLGKLLEFNPSSATELLQSRGLIVMPMTFIDGMREPAEILNMQVLTEVREVGPEQMRKICKFT